MKLRASTLDGRVRVRRPIDAATWGGTRCETTRAMWQGQDRPGNHAPRRRTAGLHGGAAGNDAAGAAHPGQSHCPRPPAAAGGPDQRSRARSRRRSESLGGKQTSEPASQLAVALAPKYPVAYNKAMVEIHQTEVYARWFRRLRDREARVRTDSRIRRLSLGNPGDVRPVGEGVSEIRIDYGPGYRVYFVQRGQALIVLLAGGDKDSQERDIRRALELARGL